MNPGNIEFKPLILILWLKSNTSPTSPWSVLDRIDLIQQPISTDTPSRHIFLKETLGYWWLNPQSVDRGVRVSVTFALEPLAFLEFVAQSRG